MAKEKKQKKGTKTASSKTTMVVDFTKDTSEGGRRRFPEGDYSVKIVKTSTGKSKEKETPYVRLDMEITEGKYKGDKVSDFLYITEKSLWRLRSVYEALGKSIPKKKVTLDFSKLVGGVLGITLSDDEYGGKVRSRVTDYIDTDTMRGADDDDEDEDDDDEDSDDDDEDLEEMDVDDDL